MARLDAGATLAAVVASAQGLLAERDEARARSAALEERLAALEAAAAAREAAAGGVELTSSANAAAHGAGDRGGLAIAALVTGAAALVASVAAMIAAVMVLRRLDRWQQLDADLAPLSRRWAARGASAFELPVPGGDAEREVGACARSNQVEASRPP